MAPLAPKPMPAAPSVIRAAVLILGVFAAAAACGRQTSPTPVPEPGLTVTSLVLEGDSPLVGQTVQFHATARHSNGLTLDVASLGTWQSSDPGIVTVAPGGAVTGVRVGEADVRVTFRDVTAARHVSLPAPNLTDFERHYIEAIFLGSGPLTPADGLLACPSSRGTWSGFPRGTTVRLRISTTVSDDKRQAIARAAAQVAEATHDAVHVTVESTSDADPRPATNEATSTTHPSPSSQGCGSDSGCTIHGFVSPGVFRSSRAVQPQAQTANAYAHDIVGHGVMGMCHVDGALIGGPSRSLMSGGVNVFSGQTSLELSALDIAAARAVYATGLGPGATRDAFVRAGLIGG